VDFPIIDMFGKDWLQHSVLCCAGVERPDEFSIMASSMPVRCAISWLISVRR
jgi:hypothetical protein